MYIVYIYAFKDPAVSVNSGGPQRCPEMSKVKPEIGNHDVTVIWPLPNQTLIPMNSPCHKY